MEFDPRQLCQPFSVPGGNLLFVCQNGFNPPQLGATQRCLQRSHAIVESQLRVEIFFLWPHCVTTQKAEPICQLTVISNDHSSLAGCYDFVGVEGEGPSYTEGTGFAATSARATSLGCIFNEEKIGSCLRDGL